MGYRTGGTWAITGPVDQIKAAWAACRLTLSPPPDAHWDKYSVFRIADTAYIRLSFTDWKWYADYPEVKFYGSVWRCLSDFAESDAGGQLTGKRIHIGEDNATEEDEFGNDPFNINLYTSCTISDDEPTEGEPL